VILPRSVWRWLWVNTVGGHVRVVRASWRWHDCLVVVFSTSVIHVLVCTKRCCVSVMRPSHSSGGAVLILIYLILPLKDTHAHTHTRLTALFPGLLGWAGTRKVKPIWILPKQETVSGSGISWAVSKSAPRSRQMTTPAPRHSSFLVDVAVYHTWSSSSVYSTIQSRGSVSDSWYLLDFHQHHSACSTPHTGWEELHFWCTLQQLSASVL